MWKVEEYEHNGVDLRCGVAMAGIYFEIITSVVGMVECIPGDSEVEVRATDALQVVGAGSALRRLYDCIPTT